MAVVFPFQVWYGRRIFLAEKIGRQGAQAKGYLHRFIAAEHKDIGERLTVARLVFPLFLEHFHRLHTRHLERLVQF